MFLSKLHCCMMYTSCRSSGTASYQVAHAQGSTALSNLVTEALDQLVQEAMQRHVQ